MAIRQNRAGNTSITPYMGYEIQVRRGVRNDSDASYSIIVTQPVGGGFIIMKRFSNIKNREKELQKFEDAKKWCIDNPINASKFF